MASARLPHKPHASPQVSKHRKIRQVGPLEFHLCLFQPVIWADVRSAALTSVWSTAGTWKQDQNKLWDKFIQHELNELEKIIPSPKDHSQTHIFLYRKVCMHWQMLCCFVYLFACQHSTRQADLRRNTGRRHTRSGCKKDTLQPHTAVLKGLMLKNEDTPGLFMCYYEPGSPFEKMQTNAILWWKYRCAIFFFK